jgi:mannose-6-phosphate isomerase-like protein (cupin superfamily)
MVLDRSRMKKETRANMRGGKGEVTLTHLGGDALQKHCRLLAELLIPPCASIGEHEHAAETEYFIILEGEGKLNDSEKTVVVKKGDVVMTGGGGRHGIENTGIVPLKLIAAIITDA